MPLIADHQHSYRTKPSKTRHKHSQWDRYFQHNKGEAKQYSKPKKLLSPADSPTSSTQPGYYTCRPPPDHLIQYHGAARSSRVSFRLRKAFTHCMHDLTLRGLIVTKCP